MSTQVVQTGGNVRLIVSQDELDPALVNAAVDGALAPVIGTTIPSLVNSLVFTTAGSLAALSTSPAAQANLVASINEVNEQIRAHTPSRYGAKLDVRWDRTGSMTAGSAVLTSPDASFVPSDVGKTVMIANAGATAGNDNDLVATVSAYTSPTQVTLSTAASATVSGAFMHIGTDDTAALQAWLDGTAAAGVIARMPLGRSGLLQQPPLRYNSNQNVEMFGNIIVGNGWGGSFALTDKQFGITNNPVMGFSTNCTFVGNGGAIIMSSAGASIIGSGKRRKGFGPAYTDKLVVSNFQVKGSRTSKEFFALQPISCRRYVIVGGFYDNQFSTSEGADGVHNFDACSDGLIIGVHTYAADDGSSNTIETSSGFNLTMERISYVNCSFRNVGHAGLKVYMNNQVGAAKINDIEYHNCTFITEANQTTGGGSPISMFLDTGAFANGARINGIRVYGGMSVTLNSLPTVYGQPAIVVNDVAGLEFHGHTIRAPGHTSIFLTRCDDAVINGCTIEHSRGPQLVTSGLSIASIAYQSGTTVRVTFTTDISALGIVGAGNAQQLIVTGAANDDNNGGFSIVGVGSTYVDVRNYKRSTTALDETGGTATAQVARTGAASIICYNCNDPRILNTKIKGAPGSAAVLLTGTANDAANFTDGAVIRGLYVTGMSFGSAILDYNTKNTEISGTRLRRSRIDAIINEAGSPGVVHGGARYIDNIDVDNLAGRALLLSNTVAGKATVHRGNLSRLSDSFRGTATQAAGSNTFNIDTAALNTGPSAEPNGTWLVLEPLAAVTSIVYTPATRRFTVTTAANAAATTVWNFAFEQPNF